MGPRRAFYAHIDASGNLCNFSEITGTNTLEGFPAHTPIVLTPGWNLVAYYPQVQLPAHQAMISVAGQLIQLKGVEGLYEPGNPFSTLNILKPGESYWLRLSTHAQLIYPSGTRSQSTEKAYPPSSSTPVVKSDSQSVLLGFSKHAVAGDIISAWVGDELRGSTVVREVEGRLGALLQIFTDSADEQVTFKLESPLQTMILGPGITTSPGSITGDYANSVYHMLGEDSMVVPELVTGLGKAYPNPFKTTANITLNIAKDASELTVGIYNIRGQKIATLLSGKQASGTLNLEWNGLDESGRVRALGGSLSATGQAVRHCRRKHPRLSAAGVL